jgi:hypothetical protein
VARRASQSSPPSRFPPPSLANQAGANPQFRFKNLPPRFAGRRPLPPINSTASPSQIRNPPDHLPAPKSHWFPTGLSEAESSGLCDDAIRAGACPRLRRGGAPAG